MKNVEIIDEKTFNQHDVDVNVTSSTQVYRGKVNTRFRGAVCIDDKLFQGDHNENDYLEYGFKLIV